MGCTEIGTFKVRQPSRPSLSLAGATLGETSEAVTHNAFATQMDPSGKSKGPPPAVKKVLSMFSSGKEEDRMVGYLAFLKIGPKLLRFLPGTASLSPCWEGLPLTVFLLSPV